MTHGTRTELACLQLAVSELHDTPISTDAIARYHSDPDYRAAMDAKRDAWRADLFAAMDAAIVRARGPHPWRD